MWPVVVWGSDIFIVWRLTNNTTTAVNPLHGAELSELCLLKIRTVILAQLSVSQRSPEHHRKSMNSINIWTSAQRDNWKKRLNYTDKSVQVAGSIFQCERIGSATYPLWYSWHSQACMQPSVPSPPQSAVITETHLTYPSYCFHLSDVDHG